MNPDNNNHPIDPLFNQQLEHCTSTPKEQNWEAINRRMNDDAIDQLYQNAMQDYAPTPSTKNWNAIQPHLPYHLRIQRQLQQWGPVAAVFLLVIIGFLFVDQIQLTSSPIAIKTPAIPTTPALDPTPPRQDYVLTIDNQKRIPPIEVNLLKEEALQTELEELLALVIDENATVEPALNQEKIEDLLKPADPLPVESLISFNQYSSSITSADKEQDLKIMIPLKVVEEHEVEHLLNIYERQTRLSHQEKEH